MAMDGYTEFGFPDVDLADSPVLRWGAANEVFWILLDMSVWPGHARYSAALAGERACFVKGELRFENVGTLTGILRMEDVAPDKDPDGAVYYDTLHGLWQKERGVYYVEGEFGEVHVRSDAPRLRFLDAQAPR